MFSTFIASFGIICLFGNTMSVPVWDWGPVEGDRLALTRISNSIGRFSGELFKTVANDHKENLIMSPLSAGILLAMATYGARGNTAQQMKNVLHLSSSDPVDQQGFQTLVDRLNNVPDVELRVANKMFLAANLPMNESYQQFTEDIFRSATQRVNFYDPENAARNINDFCEAYTNGRIKQLVTADDIDDSTKMLLVNAVYFKGNWESKFDPTLTRERPFYVGNTVKNVPMMYHQKEFNYGEMEELEASFVEIPYKGNQFSMMIVLPNYRNGLENMIPELSKMNWSEVSERGYHGTDVDLFLPKFKIESTISLTESLRKMGMIEAFTHRANFLGISDEPLGINAVVQKAFIEVNEEGTEAAAATGSRWVAYSAPSLPRLMKVDHPFAYIILDKHSNMELFSGYVRSPQM